MSIYDRNDPIASDADSDEEFDDQPDDVEPGDEAEGSTGDGDAASLGAALGGSGHDVYDPPLDTSLDGTADASPDAPVAGGNTWTVRLLAMPLLFLFAVPTIFLGLGRSSLWEPDEPRFAEASREMLAAGDRLTPYFNGEPVFEEPILYYWLQAASFERLGISEYTARMPAGLAGLGCLLLVALIGARLFSARAGLLAALALATTFRFVVSTRSGVPDTALLFFTLAALYAFIRAAESDPPGGRIAYLGWIAVGLAVLTGGLLGLLPVAIWIVWLVLTARLGGLGRMRAATGLWLMLATALPWYLYMAWTHGRSFIELALLSDVMARYEPGASTSAGGVLFALAAWPGDAMPWTIYAVVAAVSVFLGWGQLSAEQRRGAGLCVVWFGVVLATCAMVSARRPEYLLAAYPAGALLVGLLFDRAADLGDDAGPWTGLANWLTALGLLALGGLVGWLLQRLFGAPLTSLAMALPAALVLGGIFMAIFQRTGRPLWAFSVVAPVFALGYGLLAVDVVPRELERYKPARPLAQIAATQSEPGRIGMVGDLDRGLVFYSGQNVERLATVDDTAAFLAEDGLRLCVLRADDLDAVHGRYAGTLYQLAEQPGRRIRFADLLGSDAAAETTTLILVSNTSPE
ncbi:MAG: glycosyltransferase family 39 protein [Vicinamibacterales bacterium]|jgi:4-amino-4-deoxy-L-arabinose transferase-like glycosyltransferase|nr:hypothetical protein [Acidobacteriota bacterium]MDP6609278.1 glycosyltransferase family 39 protein [Vicinamibacterales bacterium]